MEMEKLSWLIVAICLFILSGCGSGSSSGSSNSSNQISSENFIGDLPNGAKIYLSQSAVAVNVNGNSSFFISSVGGSKGNGYNMNFIIAQDTQTKFYAGSSKKIVSDSDFGIGISSEQEPCILGKSGAVDTCKITVYS